MRNKIKKFLERVSIILSVIIFATAILEHFDFFDNYFLNTHELQTVANNMNTSYANVQRIYGPDDPVWDSLINLIYQYSRTNFPTTSPQRVARYVAVSSSEIKLGTSSIAEWTAPSTPLFVLYKPFPGETITASDYRIAGTIDDLDDWVTRDKDDFHFLINEVLLGGLSLIVLILMFLYRDDVGHQLPPRRDPLGPS